MPRGWLFLVVLCLGVLPAASAGGEGTPQEEATRLNQQAVELYQAGRYQEALPLQQRALEINEKALGPEHPASPPASTTWPGCIRLWGPMTRPCPSTSGP